MIVKELIEELQKFKQDSPVFIDITRVSMESREDLIINRLFAFDYVGEAVMIEAKEET